MPSVTLTARWIGQERVDRTGTGASVGADGFQDVRIHLSRLSTKMTLKAIRIEAPGGSSWEYGINLKLLPNADLIRDPKDPSQGDLFLQPVRDMAGQRIKLTAVYDDDRLDSTTLVALRCDPKLRAPQAPLPKWSEPAVDAGGWDRMPLCSTGRATCTSRSRVCRPHRRSPWRCSATRSGVSGSIARTIA